MSNNSCYRSAKNSAELTYRRLLGKRCTYVVEFSAFQSCQPMRLGNMECDWEMWMMLSSEQTGESPLKLRPMLRFVVQ